MKGSHVKNYRATIVAGVLVVCVLLLAFVLTGLGQGGASSGGLVARVHDGNKEVHEFPLDQDAEHTIETSYGSNTIQIQDGAVRMVDADCPNHSCMNQSALSAPGAQIVCLPHKLWIEVVSAGTKDASELDEDLVVWSEDTDGLDTIAR